MSPYLTAAAKLILQDWLLKVTSQENITEKFIFFLLQKPRLFIVISAFCFCFFSENQLIFKHFYC